MPLDQMDISILRDLGKRIAEIAALPRQQETIKAWKALNGLKPVRPMVMIDQLPWHEMDVENELVLQTSDPFCRQTEMHLRKTLYQWNHLPADMVVEPFIDLNKVIRGADLGVWPQEEKSILDPMNDVMGHQYLDQLKTEEDLEKIRMPRISVDEEATARIEETAHEIFDGILKVRMQGMTPMFAAWDRIVELHGVQNSIMDLVDRPEFAHQIIARVTEAYLSLLDQLEAQGLLGGQQATIHCSGAHTDELPAEGYDPDRLRARDLWTCGMAQIFSTVSPAMHQEFDLDYANRFYERFGLVYYGCCEPLHLKMDYVRKIPNLRKISMSPWVDVEKGAAQIGGDYVFSRKPSPAFLAVDNWDPQAVRRDLQQTIDTCLQYNCPVEFILKDISTVRYQPQRLWEWAELAAAMVR